MHEDIEVENQRDNLATENGSLFDWENISHIIIIDSGYSL
jgi:hypothetical protein